jgi:hypothetical protein
MSKTGFDTLPLISWSLQACTLLRLEWRRLYAWSVEGRGQKSRRWRRCWNAVLTAGAQEDTNKESRAVRSSHRRQGIWMISKHNLFPFTRCLGIEYLVYSWYTHTTLIRNQTLSELPRTWERPPCCWLPWSCCRLAPCILLAEHNTHNVIPWPIAQMLNRLSSRMAYSNPNFYMVLYQDICPITLELLQFSTWHLWKKDGIHSHPRRQWSVILELVTILIAHDRMPSD